MPLWYGIAPSFENTKTFASTAVQLDEKASKYIFVRYEESLKACWLLNKNTEKIILLKKTGYFS